jgi:hypothetical protein
MPVRFQQIPKDVIALFPSLVIFPPPIKFESVFTTNCVPKIGTVTGPEAWAVV